MILKVCRSNERYWKFVYSEVLIGEAFVARLAQENLQNTCCGQVKVIPEKPTPSFNRYVRLLPGSDDIALLVIKGHLLVEELIDLILTKGFVTPKFASRARLSFFQSSLLARALVHPNSAASEEPWRSITTLNSLRNKIAHNLEPTDVDKKIDAFIFARYSGQVMKEFRSDEERTSGFRKELLLVIGMLESMAYSISRRSTQN